MTRNVDADLIHHRDREQSRVRSCAPAEATEMDFQGTSARTNRQPSESAMEFIAQANSTGLRARGTLWRGHKRSQPFQYRHATESEQAARGVDVDGDLALEPLQQDLRAVMVNGVPPPCRSPLDLCRCRGADRLIVAVADQVVILHDPAQRRQRKEMRDNRFAVSFVAGCRIPDGCCQDAQLQCVRSAVMAGWGKAVLFEQIVDA